MFNEESNILNHKNNLNNQIESKVKINSENMPPVQIQFRKGPQGMPVKQIDEDEPKDTLMNEGNVTQSVIENDISMNFDKNVNFKKNRLMHEENKFD